MTQSEKDRLEETLRSLGAQCSKLAGIQSSYYSEYAAAFDSAGALETAKRWHERTIKIIQERVSATEAANFRRLLSLRTPLRGSLEFGEWLGRFNTYLVRLIEDIEEHPDDSSYDRIRHLQSSVGTVTPAQAKAPLEGFDVFLSHSSLDKDEARKIDEAIRQKGKTCFLAENALKPGDAFAEKIRKALQGSNEVWFLMSPNSIKSEWVQWECSGASFLEKRIVPILLRCSAADLPAFMVGIHAIDYHNVSSLVSKLGP